MSINTQIANDKRSLKRSIAAVNKILAGEPEMRARFNALIKKHEKKGHYMGAEDDTPWYKSGFANDLFSLSKDLIRSKTISSDQRKTLNLELEQIEAKNRALDKQIALRKSTGGIVAYTGSYFDELMSSPLKLAAVAGLGYLLFTKIKSRR